MQLPWKPFYPKDWHNSGSCYPCLVWDKQDNIVFTPCDPWTLNPDYNYAAEGWVCIPTAILIDGETAQRKED